MGCNTFPVGCSAATLPHNEAPAGNDTALVVYVALVVQCISGSPSDPATRESQTLISTKHTYFTTRAAPRNKVTITDYTLV